jgi:ribosomal subunit interface protein
MQVLVKGRQIDVGDAFRAHAEDSLGAILGKYFGDAIDSSVTVSRAGPLFRVVVSSHVGRGIQVETSAEATDVYPAFDAAAERLSKRLRRYKRRLKAHNGKSGPEDDVLPARQYILAVDTEETEPESSRSDDGELLEETAPPVVAEISTEIPSLTVSEAVMRLDLAETPALMFRNRAHGGLNMIYRRSDGNIGWVDPRGNRAS